MKARKLISLLIAVILLMGLGPMTAYAAGTPIVEVTDIEVITSQGQGQNTVYTFPFDGVVIIKQGGNLWVWTLDDLNDNVEQAMRIALEALLVDSTNPLYGAGTIAGFISGMSFEIIKTSGETLSLSLNGEYQLVAKKSDLAKLFAGEYIVIYPTEYQWVQTGKKDDSCTGFISLDDPLIGNSWFRMQHITLPAEGATLDIAIVAGNPNNGPNIVGTISIANVGENEYRVTFAFENQDFPPYPHEGDTCTIIEAHETVHWNYTGSGKPFDKAPGQNLAGTLDGVTFRTAEAVIDFYAHFSITTYTYVYTRVETP